MTPNPSLVSRMSARRAWTFQVGDISHTVQLGPDSAWTDRPSRLWLDGTPLLINWQSTNRTWWSGRWEARFPVGSAVVVLVCKRRVIGHWAHRYATMLIDRLRGVDLARLVRRSRGTVYILTVDGRPVPYAIPSSEGATRSSRARRRQKRLAGSP